MAGVRHAAALQRVEVDESVLEVEPGPGAVSRGRERPDATPTDDDAAGARRRTGPRFTRRRVALGIGLVAALAGTLVVLTSVDDARRDAAYAHAWSVPGLLQPLDGQVHVRWRAAAASGQGSVLVAGSTVVVVTQDEAGRHLTGYDETTGEQAWTTRVTGPVAGAQDVPLQCPSWHAGRVSDLVLCVSGWSDPVYADDDDRADGLDAVAVDARTGAEVGRWRLAGSVAGVGRVGEDLVVAVTDREGATLVERRDGRSGDVRWRYRSEQRLASQLQIERSTIDITDRVAVVRGAELVVLRLSDGAVLRSDARGQAIAIAPFRDGYAVWTPLHGGQFFDARGGSGPIPAVPSALVVDDGTGQAAAVLSTGTSVRGFSTTTGAQLWSVSTRARPRAVVSATLLVSDGGRYAAYDVHDGTPLWSRDDDDALDWAPLTDGTLALVATSGPDGARLEAIGLRDGARRWWTDLPPQVGTLSAVGGLLVGQTDGGIVVLGT